jgi:hypothetical protein
MNPRNGGYQGDDESAIVAGADFERLSVQVFPSLENELELFGSAVTEYPLQVEETEDPEYATQRMKITCVLLPPRLAKL